MYVFEWFGMVSSDFMHFIRHDLLTHQYVIFNRVPQNLTMLEYRYCFAFLMSGKIKNTEAQQGNKRHPTTWFFLGLGSRALAAHKPSLKPTCVQKRYIVCLGTGLDIQLNFKVIIWRFHWGLHSADSLHYPTLYFKTEIKARDWRAA